MQDDQPSFTKGKQCVAGLLNKKRKHKVKRGGKKFKKKNEIFSIFSINSAGLKNKTISLKSELNNCKSGVFTIQETHFNKKGKLKIENYEIFESIRKKQKGGTMLGAHKALNPKLISEYNEEFELLVVEIVVKNKEIRIITGYGPQESWPEVERMPFFLALEQEIIKAELQGKSIIIEMDSNSKLGPSLIPRDPHNQSVNGKILSGIISRHGLIVANSLDQKCTGTITRRRVTKLSIEESIIDHVLISEDLEKDLESMRIDEEGINALTKLVKTKKGVVKMLSDHNPIITTFNVEWNRNVKAPRVELFNLKNKSCQESFKELTSVTDILSSSFRAEDDLNSCTRKFIKSLNQCIRKCFRKIRIVDKPNKEIEELFDKRRILKTKKDEISIRELESIEAQLAELCAKDNYDTIKEEIENIDCEEGGVNSGHLWKLKKKLSPKCRDPPTAMIDDTGNLVTSASGIQTLSMETYKKRLENRKIKDDLKNLQVDKEALCKLRLEKASQNKTPPWTMKHLETVLKYLKKNKSRDPFGYANDIFHINVAGEDLKKAILMMMNRIKSELIYPEVLEIYDISSIYKNRGCRNSFGNYRGIFGVPILRTILDRLIYNDEYTIIDEGLSDSNVGARKKRNIRDNIFVLNAINNSVVNGKEDPVDIQIFDVEKCFDALWVEECINDVYDAGLVNDKLALLYLENQNANIAIKTQEGKSSRINIKNIIMQGTVWGSLLCTASMDKLGQMIYRSNDLVYKYKGAIDIPSLGMVDDILSVQKCSNEALKINAAVNAFIESKKLTLNSKKCHRIHVEKSRNKTELKCPELKIHNEKMKNAEQEKYLGDLINNSGTNRKNIEERRNKGFGIVAEILAILEEIPLGRYRHEIGLKLRQAMLINGILFNSEAWHAISETELRMLETVDEHLLRSLVKGQAKTPLEFLYLESGTIPIRYIIACRRLIYHQVLLKRDNSELTKKIYQAQKDNPTPGDFVALLKEDFEIINADQDDHQIQMADSHTYKGNIKSKIRLAAFNNLKETQQSHSKVRDIHYDKLEVQNYMVSPLFLNTEVNLLHALRSRSTECKANQKQRYIHTNLLCPLCEQEVDDQPHLLSCTEISNKMETEETAAGKIKYDDIFSNDVRKQKEITSLYLKLFKIRSRILEDKNSQEAPSTTPMVLKLSNNLQPCIVYSSLGK